MEFDSRPSPTTVLPDPLFADEDFLEICCRDVKKGGDDDDEVVKRGSLYRNSNEVRLLHNTESLAAKGKERVPFGLIIDTLCDEEVTIKEPYSDSDTSVPRNQTDEGNRLFPRGIVTGPKSRFGPVRKMLMNPFVKSSTCRSPLSYSNEMVSGIASSNHILDSEETENHNLSSPAHLHGILRAGNRRGVQFLEFSVKSPEDLFVAKVRKLKCALTRVYEFHSLHKRKMSDKRPSMVGEMHVSCHPLYKDSEELNDSMVTESVLYDIIHSRKSNTDRWGNCEKKETSAKEVNKEQLIRHSSEGVGFKLPTSQPELEIAAIVMQDIFRLGKAKEGIYDNSMHVLIPAGNHSLPVITSESGSDGPSRLVDRWRLGGRCDCGGWDMACPLDVFSNPNVRINVDSQYPAQLFGQGERDNIPAFSMSLMGDEKYAVDFHARLSSLQAFSVCVSILHAAEVSGRKKSSQVSRIDWPRLHAKEINERRIEAITEEEEKEEEEVANVNKTEKVLPSFVLKPPFSPIARV